jgi:hypothetical protein
MLSGYTLKEWRRPRKFRTVSGHYPRNIYQIDIAHFKTFFEKLRIPTEISKSFPNPYGLLQSRPNLFSFDLLH